MFQTVKIGPTVLEPEGERQEGRQGVSMKRERDIIYQLENAFPAEKYAYKVRLKIFYDKATKIKK